MRRLLYRQLLRRVSFTRSTQLNRHALKIVKFVRRVILVSASVETRAFRSSANLSQDILAMVISYQSINKSINQVLMQTGNVLSKEVA